MENFQFKLLALASCLLVHGCTAYDNCKDWKLHNPNIGSGPYMVGNGAGQYHEVFCEFYNDYGYMFIPKDIPASVNVNMGLLNPSTSEVLVRYRRANNKQFESKLAQITTYSSQKLSIQFNEHQGYKSPHNVGKLGHYLYLGFLPLTIAGQKTVQGYQTNGQDGTFKNCDANGNSYMAFFFDHENGTPKGYYKRCCQNAFMNGWINKGKPTTHTLSSEYFFTTEMHMGGCGGYTLSGYSTSQTNIVGAALGMKFDL